MPPTNRVFNWRFVPLNFEGAPPLRWTRFVVQDHPAPDEPILQLPALLDEHWPEGTTGPCVKVSRAWYDEFRYRLEHALVVVYQRIMAASAAGDQEEASRLLAVAANEAQMTWSEDRPLLIRELLHEWS